MLYVNDRDIRAIGCDWRALTDAVRSAVRLVDTGDVAQPVKPYLRYNNPSNRIIAMPAYVGGDVRAAGIKWIASFPGNRAVGLPRAHSIMVLNDPDTGRPYAVLNSPLPSIARTAAVSGLLIESYLEARKREREQVRLGIVGWGPVGQYHALMALSLFGERIERIRVFDIGGAAAFRKGESGGHTEGHTGGRMGEQTGRATSEQTDRQTDEQMDGTGGQAGSPPTDATLWSAVRDNIDIAASWQDVYRSSDIFITCTVSERRYIDEPPPRGNLLLNVSLRDYTPEALAAVGAIVVDDWEEVCRENTDIEQLHVQRGLDRTEVCTIADVICRNRLTDFPADEPVFVCPMGMAVFDIAAAVWYVKQAESSGLGAQLL